MSKTSITRKKLIKLSEDDWKVALDKCKKLINYRVKGRTQYGCHSEKYLGTTAIDYYLFKAIDKLYGEKWEWKKNFSISEQMCRIVGSLISDNVRKYKSEQKREAGNEMKHLPLSEIAYYLDANLDQDIETAEKRENLYEYQLNMIMRAIDGNEDMETLLLHVMDGKSNNDICKETGWEKRKLYKVTDRLKTKVKNFIGKQSKK